MSMKRNVLKKCLSEDLTWAEFLKSDSHMINQGMNSGPYQNPLHGTHARSLFSTPERKANISQELNEESKEESSVAKINAAQSVLRSGHSHQRSKHRKKGRSSGKNRYTR